MKPEKTKKRNIKKIIIIILCVLTVLAIAGYFAYNEVMYYIGDKAIRELMKNEIATAVENGSITEDELRVMAGEMPAPTTVPDAENTNEEEAVNGEAPANENPAPAVNPSETETQAPEETPHGEASPEKSQEKVQETSQEKSQTKSQEKSRETSQEKSQEKPKMSAAEKESLVDKATDNVASFVSREDKIAMAKLITSRLSSSDISYLAGLAQGGLTREERRAAAKLAAARFQGDELEQVSRFYHKYKAQIMSEPDLVEN